jgi:hypothetical protein
MLGPLRFELPGVIGRVCAVVSMLFVSVRAGSAQTNTIITFTNNLGDVIVNATVMRRDGDKLLYRFGNSGGTIRISDLPGELRKRFGSPQETAGAIDFNAAIELDPNDAAAMLQSVASPRSAARTARSPRFDRPTC